jgi:carboxyl-terminal processing protease
VVKLLVYREGGSAEGTTISITRDVINIPAVDSLMRDDGVFVITIYSFSAVSPDKFREALQQFIDSGSHRLIVDLRGNPGGYLQAAVDIGSWFLPEGTIIVTEDYGTRAKSVPHRSIGYNIFTNELKMAILVLVTCAQVVMDKMLSLMFLLVLCSKIWMEKLLRI